MPTLTLYQNTLGDLIAQGRKITADDVHHLGHDSLIAIVHPKCASLPRGGASVWRVDRANGKYIANPVPGYTNSKSSHAYLNLDYIVRVALEGKVLLLEGHCDRPQPETPKAPEPLDGIVRPEELRNRNKPVWGSFNQGLVSGWAGYED